MGSYIPTKDQDFNAWLINFNAISVASGVATYGMTSGEVTAITGVTTAFSAALALAVDPYTRTPATVAAKDTARAAVQQLVRPIAVRVSLSPSITNAEKTTLGVTVRSGTRTPIPAPVSAPAFILESAQPGLLNLQYRDSLTPTSKAKPFGCIGVEIFASIGTTAAVDPSQCDAQGTFTKSPLQLPTGPTAGKVVTVFGRWVTRSGPAGVAQRGPWSVALVTSSI